MKYKYLHTIQYPSDLKALPRQVLPDVCEELRAFIVENKHLPEIKSAQEMQENGVSVSELQTQLLQKIEELTLYLIQQEQTIKDLRKEVELLKK